MDPLLIIIPFISAIVGWLCSQCVSYYLLHYYMPQKQPALHSLISNVISNELKNISNSNLNNTNLLDKTMPLIEKHIDDFINIKLKEEIPMLSMFVGNKVTDQIKGIFITQVKELFPQIILSVAESVDIHDKINHIIAQKLQIHPMSSFIKNKLAAPLKAYHVSGLVTGFIIGVINVLIIIFYLKYL